MSTLENKKIIFAGPVGAGKTSSIQTVSDIPIVRTHAKASNIAAEQQPISTIAMDYGLIHLSENEKIHLYGTPGQERFGFMRDTLIKGTTGIILLLDNSRENPEKDFTFFTQTYKDFIKKGDVVMGVTKMDIVNKPTIQNYRSWIEKLPIAMPVFSVDARERKDVSTLLQTLLYTVNDGIKAQPTD